MVPAGSGRAPGASARKGRASRVIVGVNAFARRTACIAYCGRYRAFRDCVLPAGMRALRAALAACGEQDGFRIVQFSIQYNHVHTVVEAANNERLAKGMQAFAQSLARAINREFGRTRKVFAFRFHSTVFRTPSHARRVLAYVLGNWRHHNEDQRSAAAQEALVDPYSSAPLFDGWRQLVVVDHSTIVPAPPQTWLLRAGWRSRGGGLLDCFAIPGPPSRPARSPRLAAGY